jgi:glycosyltransferase involved in cell wall biosynthesis
LSVEKPPINWSIFTIIVLRKIACKMLDTEVNIYPQPFVSVIIPVYNDRDRLTKCLNALQFQTYPYDKYEVIVVDNASEDNIQDIVKQFHKARYEYEAQRGSYAARNKGLAVAQGEIIAFTDSDCLPNSDWITKGVQALSENPAAGIIAGNVRFFWAEERPTASEYLDSILCLRQAYHARLEHFGATANVFTSRSVFAKVGLFNAQLYSMGDKEWGKRVWAAGYEVIYSHSTIVWHPARQTQDLLAKMRRCTRGNWEIDPQDLTWSKFWFYLKPINPVEYLKAFQDANLATYKDKLAFILLLNRIKYASAFQVLGYWCNFKLAKL